MLSNEALIGMARQREMTTWTDKALLVTLADRFEVALAALYPDNLEIVGDLLILRGVHPPDYPSDMAYGALPYSDAEVVMDLTEVRGWKAVVKEEAEALVKPEMMSLPTLLAEWEPGDGGSWAVEFHTLRESHPDHMEDLYFSINKYGIIEPILLGADGRVWDGHHRLAIAKELDVSYVPVVHANGLEGM